jgi:ubiquinone/menaquinone biosynthesis C-methylase UbiE
LRPSSLAASSISRFSARDPIAYDENGVELEMKRASDKNRDPKRSVTDEYQHLAPLYEDRWSRYVSETASRSLAALPLDQIDRLLDAGCGTGALLRLAASSRASTRRVGIDLSLPMLTFARSRATNATLAAADAGNLPLPGASFDAVVTVSSFHFWTRPEVGLREIARVLRPGGRLVVTDWCDDFFSCRIVDRWLRLTRRDYHRIYGSGECAALLQAAGFDVEKVERFRVGWLWGMMTVSARLSQTI